MLPTELSQLKIEQTDWHDVKKIEFWAFITFCYYYSSNISFYFSWLKTIVQWFSFWPKETTRRGTTIIGENHKSTYTRGAYWICNRVSELGRKKWKWTRRRREEEALAYTIYIPVLDFLKDTSASARAAVAQQTWYHTTIIHTFTMSGRFMSLEAEQSHYRHFVHLPAAFLYFQVSKMNHEYIFGSLDCSVIFAVCTTTKMYSWFIFFIQYTVWMVMFILCKKLFPTSCREKWWSFEVATIQIL